MYYQYSENKGADKLRSCCEADLRLCFRICRLLVFSCGSSYYLVVGAVSSVYVGQSLDTVKVKMQTFPTLYKNALDCFIKTYQQDGIARGLYAGTVPALAANVAENSVLFLFYGICQKCMSFITRKDVKHLNPFENAVSGASAAIFSSFTLCPTELVKCRLQAMREMASQGKLEGGLERLKM